MQLFIQLTAFFVVLKLSIFVNLIPVIYGNPLETEEVPNQQTPCNDNCQNGGICNGNEDKFCKCLKGTSGVMCEIVEDCKYDFLCGRTKDVKCVFDVSLTKAVCICHNSSKMFDKRIKECRVPCTENCQNGGICGGEEDKFCKCPAGTSGDMCEIVEDCKTGLFCGSYYGVKCVFDEAAKKAVCKCDDSSKKFDKRIKECRSTCGERIKNCLNGGTCVSYEDYNFCSCRNGTHGDYCDRVFKCDCKFYSGAICYFDQYEGKPSCKCPGEREFYDVETGKCIRFCGKGKGACINGGTCMQYGKYSLCSCPNGTSGNLCEIVDECQNSRLCGSSSTVECYFDSAKGKAACRCEFESEYFDPERKTCQMDCSNFIGSLCQNGGKCIKGIKNYYCSCLPGTTGDVCNNVIECEGDLCGNARSVECYYDIQKLKASCRCQSGSAIYDPSRRICISKCDPDPCQNGGTCLVQNGEVNCICKETFSGNYCEIHGSDERYKRSKIINIITFSAFAAGIIVVILTTCCTLRRIQKLQRLMEKSNR